MKRHGQLFQELVSWPNLLRAAWQAARGKRHRENVLRFQFDYERELLRLEIHKRKRDANCWNGLRQGVVPSMISGSEIRAAVPSTQPFLGSFGKGPIRLLKQAVNGNEARLSSVESGRVSGRFAVCFVAAAGTIPARRDRSANRNNNQPTNRNTNNGFRVVVVW